MKLDNMFKKTRIVSRIQSHNAARASRPEVPEGLLRKCNKCGAAIITEDVKQNSTYPSSLTESLHGNISSLKAISDLSAISFGKYR